MDFKKALVWVVIGGALALFALAFVSVQFPMSEVKVSATVPAPTFDPEKLLERLPPAAGPSGEPRPVEIPPSKAYAPRPPAHRNPPRPGFDNPWPDASRTRAFEELKSASMAFNVDNKFNVEETGQAKVVIDFSKAVEELKSELSKSGKAGSITGGATVPVAKVVIANIIAPGLTITPITPTEQAVSETEPTTWLWDLRAEKPGTYDVRITLTASIIIDGRATNRFLQLHDETVVVEIRPEQQVMDLVKKHWQWAFSSLLVPLGVWLWKRRKEKANQ